MPLPHEGVFVRLGVSPVHGIGVFALCPIARGTRIFANDAMPVRWVAQEALDETGLSSAQAGLYRDFGVRRGGAIGCPLNFNYLTPSWYLNEPAPGVEASVATDAELNFFACRDIAEGEELTIVYAEFSEADH